MSFDKNDDCLDDFFEKRDKILFEDIPLNNLPERWPPLGGNCTPINHLYEESSDAEESIHHSRNINVLPKSDLKLLDIGQLRILEKEHEQLNGSLLSLTTHFAQVQFRLKQIIAADPKERETLLKDLEDFASKGCIDFSSLRDAFKKDHNADSSVRGSISFDEDTNCTTDTTMPSVHGGRNVQEKEMSKNKIMYQKEKQQHLIHQLKLQLQELENYAYEAGTITELPQNVLVEKQKMLLEELNKKINIKYEEINKMSYTELRETVDCAINKLLNPAILKEKLVNQLKTQIIDLERFVSYLQTSESISAQEKTCTCICPQHRVKGSAGCHFHDSKHVGSNDQNLLSKAMTIIGMIFVSFLNCGSKEGNPGLPYSAAHSPWAMVPSIYQSMPQGSHWGNLRANLEFAILTLAKISKKAANNIDASSKITSDSDYTTEDDSETEQQTNLLCDEEILNNVRKQFVPCLLELLHHGIVQPAHKNSSLATSYLPCFSSRGVFGPGNIASHMFGTETPHFWDAIMTYYEIKGGPKFNDSASRKLSRSFDLDIVGQTRITSKSKMLSVVHDITSTHQPLKRSKDAHFKAFVCHGLNQKLLVPWLRLILRSQFIVKNYYQSWSYVVKTEFADAFESLEKLDDIDYDLPVDLAVFHLKNMKEAF